jgi:hypothetical protein
MSDVSITTPPPPPPPRPPQQSTSTFDFVQPFAFVFQDERWLTKVLIGGLFQLLAFLLIGIFFVFGYCAQLTRNVIAGVPKPLPEWDRLGDYFVDGIKLFLITLLYTVPFMVIVMAVMIPAGVLGAIGGSHDNDFAQLASGTIFSLISCLIVPLSLAMSFWIPAALTFAVVEDRFGAAFEFAKIFHYIKNNFVNYLLAFVVYLVARFAVGFGFLLLCCGIFLTAFWSLIVATYAFAQAYRMSPAK